MMQIAKTLNFIAAKTAHPVHGIRASDHRIIESRDCGQGKRNGVAKIAGALVISRD